MHLTFHLKNNKVNKTLSDVNRTLSDDSFPRLREYSLSAEAQSLTPNYFSEVVFDVLKPFVISSDC